MLLAMGCRPNPAFGQFDSDSTTATGGSAGRPPTDGGPTVGSTATPPTTGADGSGVTSVGVSTGAVVDSSEAEVDDDGTTEGGETESIVDVDGEPCGFPDDLPEGLLACWNFDELEGSATFDTVEAYAMEFASAPTPNTGLFSGASIELDGLTADAVFPASPLFKPVARFTLEVWMQVQSGWGDSAASMLLRPDGGGPSLGAIQLTTDTFAEDSVRFVHSTATVDVAAGGSDFAACVAISFDGTEAMGYIRPAQGGLAEVSVGGIAPVTNANMLRFSLVSGAAGLLDGVRIWDHALAGDEVCSPALP